MKESDLKQTKGRDGRGSKVREKEKEEEKRRRMRRKNRVA